ncbi:HD domain-containing protein [Sphingomonas sp. BIUV-7]|uniref:HD domain-containing protein n=1 Tax=Sphingomonas natans TaxID=3063330 RepID=A0ABT8Y5M6_9SPHN|nr:HD domain-containing protein [Sphingomonas sp. BIUV-7]MDO6413632.1 HD domain-containing protein [Sphingomonas sp. BIUV-7]
MCDDDPFPQAGRVRMIVPAPIGRIGTSVPDPEPAMFGQLDPEHVFMMGDNPALPRMPDRPRLVDFLRLRMSDMVIRHLTVSARRALDDGMEEKIVLACLLHDISNGCLVRTDHGYWGAQMIAPYVDPEIAWAVQYHQPLRYFADEAVGYAYPASYDAFFGADFLPPDYICRDAEHARGHRWYMSARLVTLYDTYFFDSGPAFDPEIFTDIIGRHFREPEDGLGFDGSPSAHMWRSVIWPNNFI